MVTGEKMKMRSMAPEEREEAFNSVATASVIGFVEESTQPSNSLDLARIQSGCCQLSPLSG